MSQSRKLEANSANIEACTRSDASTIPPETNSNKERFWSKFEALQRLDATSRGAACTYTNRGSAVSEERARTKEENALGVLSDARKKTRRAGQEHRRSLLRASILTDAALSAEEDASLAHTRFERAKIQQQHAEAGYDFAVSCTRDEEVRNSSQKVSSLQLCLKDIEDYGKMLVQKIVCSQGNRMRQSQNKTAEILCSELETEISSAVVRFHKEIGIGGTEDSPGL